MSHVRWQQLIPIDDTSNVIVVEQSELFYIHEGHGFSSSLTMTIAAAATGYVLLKVGASAAYDTHIQDYLIETTSAPMTVVFSEGAVVSADGTPGVLYQMNRANQATTYSTIFTAPTVTNAGTPLRTSIVTGSKQDGGFGRGAAPKELVLQNETNYLWAITNNSAGSANIAFNLFLVET